MQLGEKLGNEVKFYIQAVWERGGVITTTITMAAATAIVRRSDRNLLSENGGSISITPNWAKSLLCRLNFVKRKGSSTMKMTVENFEVVKEQFILNIRAVVEMEDIPPELHGLQLGPNGDQHCPRIIVDNGGEGIQAS